MTARRPSRRALRILALAALLQAVPAAIVWQAARDRVRPLPSRLEDTGLYSDIAAQTLADGVLPFEPQYPLWTDGAAKRRWIRVPPGESIDASDPDHFKFPIGTRVWKEFGFEQPVETRYMELGRDGGWRFATYRWSADGKSAELAPEEGVPAAARSAEGAPYDIPSRSDCLACHAAGPDAVLGFTALQLSPDRDPLAPHAKAPAPGFVDLASAVRDRLVTGLPERFLVEPPRIAAASPRERAVLGYLSANCGSCHTSAGALAGLGLDLSYSIARPGEKPAIDSTLDRASRFRWPGDAHPLRISTATPDASILARRMASRQPLSQMPPLGTHVQDRDALELVNAWMREELVPAPCVQTLPTDLQAKANQP